MCNAGAVEQRYGVEHRGHDSEDRIFGEGIHIVGLVPVFLHELAQADAVYILHYIIGCAVGFEDIEDFHQVGVLQVIVLEACGLGDEVEQGIFHIFGVALVVGDGARKDVAVAEPFYEMLFNGKLQRHGPVARRCEVCDAEATGPEHMVYDVFLVSEY